MARLKVFDTNALVAVFHGRLVPDAEHVHVAVSLITRMELMAWPNLAERDRTLVQEILSKVDVISIDGRVESHAVQIRLARQLKLPDAIIAGTALSLNAPLVTNDATFNRIPKLVVETF